MLRAKIQQKRAALSKSFKSSLSLPVSSVRFQISQPDTRSTKKLDDLRKYETSQDRVAQQLAQLAVGNDCSSSDSDAADGEESDDSRSPRVSRRSAGKSLRSGKTVKPTSKVISPQLWPHSELNLSACSKEVTYDKLSIEEFAAGYATILRSRKLSTSEKQAREEHLIHLMYLAMKYEWHAVPAYHGAVLLEIEGGHAAWGASFHHLDARILQGHFKLSGTSVRQSASQDSRPVLFCQDYQRGTCNFSRNHSGLSRCEAKFHHHICATCWVRERKKHAHRENSEQCPLRQTSDVDPPTVSGNFT